MKRNTPLRSKKPLEPGKPLARTSGFARTGRIKSKPKRKPLFDDRLMRQEWHDHAVAQAPVVKGKRVCPVCGAVPSVSNPWEAHHVTPKQTIKAYAKTVAHQSHLEPAEADEMLSRLLWDFRNGLAVCRACHARHTGTSVKIPIRLITRRHRQFAREVGKEYLLDVSYTP